MSKSKPHWWDRNELDRASIMGQRQLAQEAEREKAAPFNRMEIEDRERDYAIARERARLSVLTLTPRDIRFLKSLKIAI